MGPAIELENVLIIWKIKSRADQFVTEVSTLNRILNFKHELNVNKIINLQSK